MGSSSSDTWYSVVAENGLVLSIEENTDLNILYSEDLKNPGEFVEPEVLKGYMVYKYIQPYFKVEQAEIHQDALFLQTNKGHQALLPFDKDEKLLIGSIMVVFNRLNSSLEKSIMDNRDSQKISELCINGCLIDFRFQNPIIKAKI